MDLAAMLQAHIEAVEGKPVVWGESDCTSWAASWVEKVTGDKPPFLAGYSSLEQAHALIDEAGGLDVLWGRSLSTIGIFSKPDYAAALGDIGIVDTASFGPVGVIFAQDGVALWRADNGTALLRPRSRNIVKVWNLSE
ncbi:DUF6950 family protein [Mesorhizobium sp. SP-1A]|uniref:DUF6950 family protein n=1 Tax=Mesorhizobium sp. SP-1A TaxID=3077840 RepID=UPI0028F70F96|nr:hypothetical protein [Mesorhizobium sp. SP-1A]